MNAGGCRPPRVGTPAPQGDCLLPKGAAKGASAPQGRFFWAASPALRGAAPQGFTLVEMVVVIVILGILAAVAVPRFVGRDAFDELGYADQVRASIRYAQKIAIAERREICLVFTATTVALQRTVAPAVPGSACDPANPVNLPGSSAAYIAVAPTNVGLASVPAGFGFDGMGRPVPNAAASVTVTGKGSRVIAVAAETGYVN